MRYEGVWEWNVNDEGYGENEHARWNLLIRLPQQTLKTQQHALHVQHGAPLILQNIEADTPTEVDVGVIDWGAEENCRRAVRIICRESKRELEG